MRSVHAMMSFYNAREVRTNTNRPVMTVSPCDFFPPGKGLFRSFFPRERKRFDAIFVTQNSPLLPLCLLLKLQLNIANPATGCQKKIEITDENKLRVFYDKRISAEVEADSLGDEWKGYIFKIMGGNDKQGFGMKQGVLTNQRVFLLQVRGTQGFQGHGRRKGERRRKACRGCIVSQDISVLNVAIVKQGDADVPGLTDTEVPRMRGPKRASKIRKLFALSKEDSVFPYVNSMRREFESATGKKKSKAQKVQRVVTPLTLQRKRARAAVKKAKIAKSKAEAGEYHKLLQMRIKEQRERRSESIAKRRASSVAKKAA